MPYYRRRNKSPWRRRRPKSPFSRYKRMKWNRKKNYIARITGAPERKFMHTQITGSAVSSTFSSTSLVLIDEGTGVSDRIGRKIVVTSIQIKFACTQNTNAANTFLRLLIVKDKQANEGGITGTDLLYDTSVYDAVVSSYNLDQRYRFKVLRDRVFEMCETGESQRYYKCYIKCHIPITYDGTGNGQADLTSNNLCICMISNEATNTPSVTYDCVVRYVDA